MRRFPLMLALLSLMLSTARAATFPLPATPPKIVTTVTPANPAPGSVVTIAVTVSGQRSTPSAVYTLSATCVYRDISVDGVDTMCETVPATTVVTIPGSAGQTIQQPTLTVKYPAGWLAPTTPTYAGFINPTCQFGSGTAFLSAVSLPADTTGTASWQMTLP